VRRRDIRKDIIPSASVIVPLLVPFTTTVTPELLRRRGNNLPAHFPERLNRRIQTGFGICQDYLATDYFILNCLIAENLVQILVIVSSEILTETFLSRFISSL
jgi:hypothetical protein